MQHIQIDIEEIKGPQAVIKMDKKTGEMTTSSKQDTVEHRLAHLEAIADGTSKNQLLEEYLKVLAYQVPRLDTRVLATKIYFNFLRLFPTCLFQL